MPPPLTASAIAGERVYAANGCIYLPQPASAPRLAFHGYRERLGAAPNGRPRLHSGEPAFPGHDAHRSRSHEYRRAPALHPLALPASLRARCRHAGVDHAVVPVSFQSAAGKGAAQFRGGRRARPARAAARNTRSSPRRTRETLAAYLLSLKHNYPLPEAGDPPATASK